MLQFRLHTIIFIILIGLISIDNSAVAQEIPLEVEGILKKHYEAIGLQNKNNINTLVSIGEIKQLGTDLQISIIQKRPSNYRMDVHLNEGRISQGFDGKIGWMLNPFISPDTVSITGPELSQLKESAVFDGVLVNYDKLGYTVDYEAAGMWNDHPVFILVLKKDNGIRLRFFLDAETYLIHKTEATYLIDGLTVSAESEFSDYKVISGVRFPYRIINRNGQMMTEIKIDTIRINEDLDNTLFR